MSGHFDAVVVGSGFGGSVMAYRLAKAGMTVCLLERGRAYPPGAFPRDPRGLSRSFWDPSRGLFGMFNPWSFRGLAALVSSGLGGGSLIYANVLLRKDREWFREEDGTVWPVTREELDPHYERVERMLGAQPYPFSHSPYSDTRKTQAMRAAADGLREAGEEVDFLLPNLAVTFANPGRDPVPGEPIEEPAPNYHGRTRSTCRLCGECDVGCNYGSKNTLDYNYVTGAAHHGASIRPLAEVKSFEPVGEGASGGFRIRYVQRELDARGEELRGEREVEITAGRLILSAGTLGTTYLLLRNRERLPGLGGKALGKRFCGNGDLLTFAFGCKETEGGNTKARWMDPSRGPVITSAIRVPDAADGNGTGRGFYVEDAGFPAFLSWLVEVREAPRTLARFVRFWTGNVLPKLLPRWMQAVVGRPETDLGAEISAVFGKAPLSATSLPMLGMGRDTPDGVMTLEGKRLEVDWSTRTSGSYFEAMRRVMKAMTRVWGGRFQDNPMWAVRRVVTVHPLGGCPMGRSPEEGVVDPLGRVFGYEGRLYVADGSVMPGPVGANPALTIAALADRFADGILREAGLDPGAEAGREEAAASA